MSTFSALLQAPATIVERCHRPDQQQQLVRWSLLWIFFGSVAFGAVVGSYRGTQQAALSALKIPLATLLCLSVVGPALRAVAKSFGRDWDLRATVALLLCAGARSSLVLLACSPVLWLAIDLGASYSLCRLLAAAFYGAAGLSGAALLSRALGPAPGRTAALLLGGALFSLVAAQSAWLLRPYIGDPDDRDVPVLAHGRVEGGVLGVLARDAWDDPR